MEPNDPPIFRAQPPGAVEKKPATLLVLPCRGCFGNAPDRSGHTRRVTGRSEEAAREVHMRRQHIQRSYSHKSGDDNRHRSAPTPSGRLSNDRPIDLTEASSVRARL